MLQTDDTIVAIASPRGGALRGIVRVSGPQVVEVLERCFSPAAGQLFWETTFARVESGHLLLHSVERQLPGRVILWPNNRCYTGQPSAEFHTIGSAPLLEEVVRTIRQHGARLAEPGEFTLRAFLAGRLDLTQAEAVLGVIDATDAKQAETALSQLAGGLSQPLQQLRDRLLNLIADLEAGLDFVEEDIEFVSTEHLKSELDHCRIQVEVMLERMSQRELPQQEFRIVLTGRPNVGKSSLMNSLSGQDVAIVADHAGTTRDYLEQRCQIGEYSCLLIDTAGREVTSPIGIDSLSDRQAASQVDFASIELLCIDATRSLDDWELAQLQSERQQRIVVLTKSDCIAHPELNVAGLRTSSVTGAGCIELKEAIAALIAGVLGERQDVVSSTASRCHGSLQSACDSLAAALLAVDSSAGDELIAFEIRQAAEEIGLVAGTVYTDDILDRVFSRFCIGK